MLLVHTSRLSRLVPRIHQLRILGTKLLLCQMLDQRARRQHAILDFTHALKTPVHSPEQRQIEPESLPATLIESTEGKACLASVARHAEDALSDPRSELLTGPQGVAPAKTSLAVWSRSWRGIQPQHSWLRCQPRWRPRPQKLALRASASVSLGSRPGIERTALPS
jgi:hypothetical protein